MRWVVKFHKEFDKEFDVLPQEVQDEILALSKVLEQFRPALAVL